ncbi:AraC family transcriptional regulator [Pseudomonas sp. N3-W]|uniref:AraC family transcriptional regulator n=1 Tax=Pseudomonas fungipugnans TaxID=3024217 RepID=A0ABT6QHX0_9PSED|nr:MULTISPECIES: AraC family transcriptional regulator [unclassified Pseudomonas]MDI2590385.1 AraC family transcriptional regulator [Pseudomonas sp. 681]UWF51913.1 AraC family transcriptional regulator [Pseudomonas sp. N3-W]
MSGSKIDTPGTDLSLREEALQPTTIGSYTVAIGRALDASGVDSKRIFTAIGIPLDVATDPMTRQPASTMTRLYRACVEVTNNPYFGLTVAKHIHLTHLHALGYSLAASGTLMDFCRRLERYFRLVSQVAKVNLTQVDGQVMMRFDHLVELSSETEDAFFGFLIRTMRLLYKQEFKPLRVEFCRSMPHEGAGPYETLFRVPVLFNQTSSLLVFDQADMVQALSGSCPELAQVNDNIVISYLARLDKSDVITGVTQKIIEFLPDGDCTRDKVASALHMSPTKLQLKLSQRGTHFQQLLDDTRKELACSYLRQASRPVTEITFLLGFSDTSNFTRAFKRWTGLSPTDFRQQP